MYRILSCISKICLFPIEVHSWLRISSIEGRHQANIQFAWSGIDETNKLDCKILGILILRFETGSAHYKLQHNVIALFANDDVSYANFRLNEDDHIIFTCD